MSAEFIQMISDLHEERFNMYVTHLAQNHLPCGIFYGFEVVPNEMAESIQSLKRTGLNVSCAIALADVQAAALRKYLDVPVVVLEDFDHFGEENFPAKPQAVFIRGRAQTLAFVPYFARYGIESLNPLGQGEYFALMMKHLPELYRVYEMLGGDESKKVFIATIKGNLTSKMSDYRFAPEAQYFLEGFTPRAGDIAIDGGAYDGSTALAFAGCGAKVFAFEMDAVNFQNCQRRLANHGECDITLENLGLSDRAGVERYFSGDVDSRKDPEGTSTANFIDLDTYVARKNLPRIDYIKLDIEGAELAMLHGAAETIKRCKPKMAVSAYHKSEDLWTLAPYIKSLRPDYEFEFRHYRIDCTDYMINDNERAILKFFGLSWLVPTQYETVLYCR